MKYSSYSNELLDKFSNQIKIFDAVKHRLPKNHDTDAYATSMKEVVKPFCSLLEKSIKFKLPEGGFLVSATDNLEDYLKNFINELNLPYDVVALELDSFVSGDYQNSPILIILEQDVESIRAYLALKGGTDWQIVEKNNFPVFLKIDRDDVKSLKLCFIGEADTGHVPIDQISGLFYRSVFGAFVSFICALSCGNTVIEDSPIQPSKIKNSIRKSKGKLPFFTHKILTIDTQSSVKNHSSKIGSHNSPRVHLRRGHIRRLPNKNVWVNSCVVGDKSKGIVSKDYAIV